MTNSLHLVRSRRRVWPVTMIQDDGVTPINLTGCTVTAGIYEQDGVKVCDVTWTLLDASLGTGTLELAAADAARLVGTDYLFGLEITDSLGMPTTDSTRVHVNSI